MKVAMMVLAAALAAGCGEEPASVDYARLAELGAGIGEGAFCAEVEGLTVLDERDAPPCPDPHELLDALGLEVHADGRVTGPAELCPGSELIGTIETYEDETGAPDLTGSVVCLGSRLEVVSIRGRVSAWTRAPGEELIFCHRGRVETVAEWTGESVCARLEYARSGCARDPRAIAPCVD